MFAGGVGFATGTGSGPLGVMPYVSTVGPISVQEATSSRPTPAAAFETRAVTHLTRLNMAQIMRQCRISRNRRPAPETG
jgi:hypothetical protein